MPFIHDTCQTFYEDETEMPVPDNGEAVTTRSSESGGRKGGHHRIFPVDELTVLTGDRTDGQLCKTLIQLVMADFVYADNSERGTCTRSTAHHYRAIYRHLIRLEVR